MAKAMRMMEENVNLSDAVVFVLDARAPAATYNEKLTAIAGSRPVLYLLNKWDLGNADTLLSAMKGAGKNVFPLDATSPRGKNGLVAAMNAVAAEKAQRLKEKGSSRPLRFLVAGVPNTGKSTVINLLSGAKRAVTGDKAGVTRSKQWVKCGAFDLMDTPGTMPPSFANQTLARRLAYIGSVNDDILELDEIALALLQDLLEIAPAALLERYGIDGGTPLQMLEQVCTKRGFLLKGKEFDYERGERAVIDDFRKGKLGRITFDTVDDAREAGLI